MIRCEVENIPIEHQDKIKAWLQAEGRRMLEDSVKGTIASLQSEATNRCLEGSTGVLSHSDMPSKSKSAMLHACTLQVFLDVLQELDKQTTFQKSKLTIY